MTQTLSKEYKQILRQMHKQESKWGSTAGRWAKDVINLATQWGADSILDYGCGKCALSEALRKEGYKGIISEYDPGIDERTPDVMQLDLVTCIDVMEHVEGEYVDAVIKHIADNARIGAFFVISKNKAVAKLPDGRNAHLTIAGNSFWIPAIEKHMQVCEKYDTSSNELVVIAKTYEVNNG